MPPKRKSVSRTKPSTDEGTLKSIHIQCRINPNLVREQDAYQVYMHWRNKRKEDRWIIREALIALGVLKMQGWQPQEVTDSLTLSATAVRAVEQMAALTPLMVQFQQLVQQLLTLDLSALRYVDGSPADIVEVTRKLSAFEKSAQDMLGETFVFDVDE